MKQVLEVGIEDDLDIETVFEAIAWDVRSYDSSGNGRMPGGTSATCGCTAPVTGCGSSIVPTPCGNTAVGLAMCTPCL